MGDLRERLALARQQTSPFTIPGIPQYSQFPQYGQLPQYSPTPVKTIQPQVPEVYDIDKPLWQRGLELIGAPFEWTQQNVINPALSLVGTGIGIVPESERLIGEDYWDWKRRSWDEWDDPGIDFDVPWSDKPWKIGIKGIAEFAPWLLIPGAGQIGGGLIKGASMAGKLSPLVKALGMAVKYSPWGVMESVTGKAIGKAAGALSAGAGRVSTAVGDKVFGKITPREVDPVIAKFTNFFKEQVGPKLSTRRAERAVQLRAARGRMAQVERDYAAGKISIDELNIARKGAAKGSADFGKVAAEDINFTPDEIRQLKTQIEQRLGGWDAIDANDTLDAVLLGFGEKEAGTILNKAKWNRLGRGLGKDFSEALRSFTTQPASRMNKLLDIANAPRAVLASWDMSATLRQGLILSLLHPKQVPKAFYKQLRAYASEKLSLQADDILRAKPITTEFEKVGGYLPSIRTAANIAKREESYMSKFAESIPGVRRSERAYITYLNEMRVAAYETASQTWRAMGAIDKDMKGLAQFINAASGRGNISKNLERYSPMLSTLLFSPRLQLSRLQLPKMLVSKNPYVRKEAQKALVRFIGTGTALLTLLHQTGVGKVELDPRSADFGKIKIKDTDTRLDIWTGYAQYVRFMAQMVSGERKTSFGNMTKAQRDQTAWRFLQSKGSPAFGLMIDILRGESYMGEKLFDDTTGAIKQFRNRFFPLFVQDMLDASEQSGVNGMLASVPAALGVGVLTYSSDFAKVKDKVAHQEGFDSWEETDPLTRRKLERNSPVLQQAMIEYDREIMGTQWGDWRLAGNAVEDVFRSNVQLASAEFGATGDGYTFKDKIDAASNARRESYKARERNPVFEEISNRMNSKTTEEALLKLGPEQMAIKIYNDALYGDDMYDQYGNYDFAKAADREQLFIQKYGQESLDYIKEYMGSKWEETPQYQELRYARQILKPYWEIQTDIESRFGKAFAESRAGQRLITNMKKIKRLKNPEIDKYIKMFYTQ